MKANILIFGAGFIGKRLRQETGWDISRKKIISFNDAQSEIKKYRPKIIINCIGYTGEVNISGCENRVDKTLTANVFIPLVLAEAAIRNRIKLIHISTGCIYNFDYKKDKPIKEEKVPDFFDLCYSRSKIYSEMALGVLCNRYGVLIARIRVPLDDRPHPRNLLTKLIKYRRVIELSNSVTYIPDFIAALKHLIKKDARGIYNIVNRGGLRYSELMDTYKKYVPDFEYKKIKFKQLNQARTNLFLSTRKLENSGFKARNIREVLDLCVKNYLKY